VKKTALFSDVRMLEHQPGAGHPESPERLRALLGSLEEHPIPGTEWLAPRLATPAELARVHAPAYLEALARLEGHRARLDPDTTASPGSWTAARLAAGAAVRATEVVWAGEARNAFALVRPPGHHAERDRAMGFCLINNAAVAAQAALDLGARRVAILDWDVHHGNGTQHLFEARPDVLYLSVHQSPFYPGTGAPGEVGTGPGAGFTVNCALPPGQGDADYGVVFEDVFAPALDAFAPELVVVSAGFDAHARDPIGEMRLTERAFAAMCAVASDATPDGRLVLVLEGGYDLGGLTDGVRACLESMTSAGRESFPRGASPACASAVREARAAHPTLPGGKPSDRPGHRAQENDRPA
jgi:acetoin utilization deacetylase AcuC-like enzyme